MDGTQLVVKVNRDLDEQEILKYLHSRKLSSEYIIPLLDLISTNLGPGMLLPLRQPVLELFARPEGIRGRFLSLAEDLLKAIAFIHDHLVAHRDIKPDNLVCTDSFRLQLIGFDIAIKLKDTDELVTESVGTEGFRAPEVESKHDGPMPHSPIKADRYSCGVTILRMLSYSDDDDKPVFQAIDDLAHQLMDGSPGNRPNLTVWHEEPRQHKRDMESESDVSRKKPRVNSAE